ncbi:hypothetical protein B0H13DRAFT_1993783, partial [Mycena leptocephala]
MRRERGEGWEGVEGREIEHEQEKRAPITTGTGEPIQVLFLSREKFDAYTRHSGKQLTPWQAARHIANEAELLAGLREGLRGLCRAVTPVPGTPETPHTSGTHDCTFTDADALPGSWGARMHAREARALGLRRPASSSSHADAAPADSHSGGASEHADAAAAVEAGAGGQVGGDKGEGTANERRWVRNAAAAANASHSRSGDTYSNEPRDSTDAGDASTNERRASAPRALRFATLDPTTSALAAQLGAVGRADVVVSVHAGALGLTLFMPTGRASVVELVTTGAQGNYHFHNMAHMMGMEYLRVDVQKNVDVSAVVRAVRGVVERRL